MQTPILIKVNNLTIPAALNETVAAKDFQKRMPLKVSGCRFKNEYCCSVACGVFDPQETTSSWVEGDISLSGGWLSILFQGEKISPEHHSVMIIGHIETKNLPLIKNLPADVKFLIELKK